MVRISGKVISYWRKKPLEGVTISVAGRTTTTGPDGRFSIDIPKGSYSLRAMKPDYETASTSLSATEPKTVTVRLKPIAKPL